MAELFPKSLADKIDSHSVYKTYERWPELAKEGLQSDVGLGSTKFSKACFMGMGGSAAGGDIVAGWLADRPGVEMMVYKGHMPVRNMKGTLAVACSASGDTAETVEMLHTAVDMGATVVSISGGGALMEISRKLRIHHIKMPKVVAPRYMLPFIVFAAVAVVDSGLGLGSRKEARDSLADMIVEGGELGLHVPFNKNPSKKLASKLLKKTPAIYGDRIVRGVGNRFKNVMNENSKKHSQFDGLPDAFHNEIEAWEDPGTDFLPIFLRHTGEKEFDRERTDKMAKILSGSGKGPVQVRGRGTWTLSQLVTMAYRLDMTSYYAALGLRRDPFPTALIDRLKK
jgi:bifunctional phosphoglucose/phosphomannose isomerase